MTKVLCDFICKYNSGKTEAKPGECTRDGIYLLKCGSKHQEGEMVCDVMLEPDAKPDIDIAKGNHADAEDKELEKESD